MKIFDGDGRHVASTVTGDMGIWKIENVSEGGYLVVFETRSESAPERIGAVKIAVSEDDKEANESITWWRQPTPSERRSLESVAPNK